MGLYLDFREFYVPWQIIQFFKETFNFSDTFLSLIITLDGQDEPLCIRKSKHYSN